MFTNKKYLFALALVAPMFGCPADDTDDTTTTSVGETSASTTGGTSTSTTTATSDTTDGPTTGMTSGMDTTTGGTTGGGDGMACFFTCEAAEDCCAFYGAAEELCVEGFGEFPYALECDAEGFCVNDPGCTEDQQCVDALQGDTCVDGLCYTACTEDADCEDANLIGYTCTGAGGTVCEFVCEEDADCNPGGGDLLVCTDGACDFAPCTEDADCEGPGGVCDVATGECTCTTDRECAEGYGCG
jgi:hypothetical protein